MLADASVKRLNPKIITFESSSNESSVLRLFSKDFENLMLENSELKDYCYKLICEACILKYDSKELGIDDVTETEEAVDEL